MKWQIRDYLDCFGICKEVAGTTNVACGMQKVHRSLMAKLQVTLNPTESIIGNDTSLVAII